MRIVGIHIDGFGKFHNYDLGINEGINVITGVNEAGKTTLHSFIRAMLYGASTRPEPGGRMSLYRKYRPWANGSIYGGYLDVESQGRLYRISRDFSISPGNLSLSDITWGEGRYVIVPDAEDKLRDIVNGLSETSYINTISFGQLGGATRRDMSDELQKYAANVSTTLNPSLNAKKALDLLRRTRDSLNNELKPDIVKEYNSILTEIKNTERGLKDPARKNDIVRISGEKRITEGRAEDLKKRIADNEISIRNCKSGLDGIGIGSERDIDELKYYVENRYDEFKFKSSVARRSLIAGLLCLILGAVCIVMLIFDPVGATAQIPALKYVFTAIAAAAVVAGIAVLIRYSGSARDRDSTADELDAMFERFLLDSDGNRLSEDVTCDTDGTAGKAWHKGKRITEDSVLGLLDEIESYRHSAAELSQAEFLRNDMLKQLGNINDEQVLVNEALTEQKRIQSGVEAGIDRLQELKKRAAVLKRDVEKNRELREKIDAVELAIEKMEELAETVESSAGVYINAEAGRMLNGFSGGAYDSLNAGPEYELSINTAGRMMPVSSFSQGTADQVYMAVRLATIRFIAGDDDELPLILDDSFALYDDERLKKAIAFLSETYKGQVVIFTCHNRESSILSEAGIAHSSLHIA